jgi:hypothetical protein
VDPVLTPFSRHDDLTRLSEDTAMAEITGSRLVGLVVVLTSTAAHAQIEFEREPILYGKAPFHDAVTSLEERLAAGEATVEYDDRHGYLPSLLRLLDVPLSSQVLVNSKTSLQMRRISPRNPRALYFNDEVYVGWVRGGDVIEVMATDPQLGEVFYTFPQEEVARPAFTRDGGNCLVCHASSRTRDVPGALVRSVVVDRGGQPLYGAGTFNTDHTSPFAERWGGWYVTGTHGRMRHMGNVFASTADDRDVDREAGANVTDLSPLFDADAYPTPHSDIVALMVLEHQTRMQNLMTRAAYEARSAAHHDGIMNRALARPDDFVSDTTRRRIASAGEDLVRYMLFVDEFPLTDPVEGTSMFAEEFSARGRRDDRGRSLRDFDLRTRMFRYPCSYLVHSAAFDRLPQPVREYVAGRLHEVLTGQDASDDFAHLSEPDRRAIREILEQTKPELWTE